MIEQPSEGASAAAASSHGLTSSPRGRNSGSGGSGGAGGGSGDDGSTRATPTNMTATGTVMSGAITQSGNHHSLERHCFPSISTLFARSESIDFSSLHQVRHYPYHTLPHPTIPPPPPPPYYTLTHPPIPISFPLILLSHPHTLISPILHPPISLLHPALHITPAPHLRHQVEQLIDNHDKHNRHRQNNGGKGTQTSDPKETYRTHRQSDSISTTTQLPIPTTTPITTPMATPMANDRSKDPVDLMASAPALVSVLPYSTKLVLKVISSDVSVTTSDGPVLNIVGNTSVTGW